MTHLEYIDWIWRKDKNRNDLQIQTTIDNNESRHCIENVLSLNQPKLNEIKLDGMFENI